MKKLSSYWLKKLIILLLILFSNLISTSALEATSTVLISPTSGTIGSLVTVQGHDFLPTEEIRIDFGDVLSIALVTQDATGTFTTSFIVPYHSFGMVTVGATGISSNAKAEVTFYIFSNIGSLTATPGHNKIVLNWLKVNLDIVMLIRNIGNYPATITDGILKYSGTDTTYIDRDVINGIPYYYTVFYSTGSFSCAHATPQKDTSPPCAPGTVTEGLLDKDLNDTGAYTVYWGLANDVESEVIAYELQESKDNGSWTSIAITNALNYSFVNKESGKFYSYRVRAKNEAELWSTWSTTSDGIRVVNRAVELPATQTVSYDQMKVDIPANAFIGSVTFTISKISPPIDFASSTPKMNKALSSCYKLLAFDAETKEIQPIGSLTLILSYIPYLLGSETDYRFYRLDGNWWNAIGTPTIIPEEDMIMMEIDSLSTYVVGWPVVSLDQIGSFTANAGNNREVIFNWVYPDDERIKEIIIIRNTGTYATNIGSGTQIFRGTRTQTLATYTETLENLGTVSYYTAFASDGINYSSGVFAQAIATDTTPPGLVGSFSVKGEFKKVVLSWKNPDDKDFDRVEIIRHLYHFPQTPKDGIVIYKGKGTTTTDEGLLNGQVYYYTAFTFDGINYSLATTTTQGSVTPASDNSFPSTIGTITEGYWTNDIDVSNTGSYWVCWAFATDTESGIASYELQERKNSGNWNTVSDNITGNYYFILGREFGSTYYYRVRAKNGAGMWGSWSTTSDGIRVVSDYFNLSKPISFATGSEKIKVDVPANAFEGTITFTITHFSSLPVSNFAQATPKIKKSISSAWELLAINTNNEAQLPTTTLTIFITYPDAGLSQNEEEKLRIYRLNENNNRWEMIPGEIIYPEDNMIRVTITTLSTFIVALPSYPASTLTNVKVYPNPFKPTQGHNKITFEGLEDNVKIRIYKITGELVYEEEYPSTNGYEYWYVTNDHGEPLASGVYIYVIEGSNGEKAIGKIAIIR